METAQLQLVLNVIAITAVSTAACFSYLGMRDRKLAKARKVESAQEERAPSVVVEKSTPGPSQRCASPAPSTEPLPELDIRHLAASRRTRWVNGVAAAMPCDRR
jgi:hypothetical protein